jgi:hypothetical protein
MKRLILIILILITQVLLAACQPAVPEATPEIETLLVQITPSALPVLPAVQACGELIPNVYPRVVERFADQAEPELLIRLGEPEGEPGYLAQIATEEIGIVLHPDNPANSLTLNQITDLITGKTTSWADLGGIASPVAVWGLYPGDEIQQAFEDQVLARVQLVSSAILAPGPDTLGQAIAADPTAIGILSYAWAPDELKFILVGLRLPVLISTSQPLEGPAAELAACLQGETGQTILDAIYP